VDEQALQTFIRTKLTEGRLPLNRFARVWGGPGRGETCGACETTITKDQLAVEGIAFAAGGGTPIVFHAGCFQIWQTERRTLLKS
jgi:hypothetical protein